MSDEQKKACEVFTAAIRPAFPDSHINAYPRTLLGEETICITFALHTSNLWINGIIENDPAFCKFLVQSDSNGFVIEAPTTHSNAFKRAGVKYRKITATTETEALHKLAQWFLRNQVGIYSTHQRA